MVRAASALAGLNCEFAGYFHRHLRAGHADVGDGARAAGSGAGARSGARTIGAGAIGVSG